MTALTYPLLTIALLLGVAWAVLSVRDRIAHEWRRRAEGEATQAPVEKTETTERIGADPPG